MPPPEPSPTEAGNMRASRAVIVTGCSTGIGRATAMRLHRAGYPMYATARKVETLQELADAGIVTLPLDVTDEMSMMAAVDQVVADHGAVGVLVNNAGYSLSGPIEEVQMDSVRAQFETNLFGAARLCQLVLPGMRAQQEGRIVNVSSLYGRFSAAGAGFYHASKHALEGLSDALRHEVRSFGVKVVIIEPGPVKTAFGATTVDKLNTRTDDGPYAEFNAAMAEWYRRIYAGPDLDIAGKLAVTADQVAAVIEKGVRARRPRARYPVGFLVRALFAVRRFAPNPIADGFIRRRFPAP
jgi:NAD(P)-dependent dehydrogenase (short-subunit alcohol dehydrogenase family)